MNPTRFIRLTQDIANPTHDRRCKYGLEAVPVFKAGEAFVVIEPRNPDYSGEIFVNRVSGRRLANAVRVRELQQLVLAHSVDSEPRTLKEILAAATDPNSYEYEAFAVLSELLKRGTVSADLIKIIAQDLAARGDEPNEEVEG